MDSSSQSAVEASAEDHSVHRKHRRFAIRLARTKALTRLGASIVVGVVAGLLLPSSWSTEVRVVASWVGFAVTALALTWYTILNLRPEHIRRVAQMEDPSRGLASVLVVLGASASLLSVVVLLQESMTMARHPRILAVSLALSAVMLAWVLIHTVFTLRYAHQFYGAMPHAGGLGFPGGEDCPDYLDFAYFAFVVGMTAQTSDITVTSRIIRRTALLHGVISFAFNTAVVALSIGVLSTLL